MGVAKDDRQGGWKNTNGSGLLPEIDQNFSACHLVFNWKCKTSINFTLSDYSLWPCLGQINLNFPQCNYRSNHAYWLGIYSTVF